MPKSVLKNISYSARRGADGDVELLVEVERIGFVEEVIPYGELAGTIGHREVPSTNEMRFSLHPDQARELARELDSAAGA